MKSFCDQALRCAVLLSAALALPLTASARIGETPEQCRTRYGPELTTDGTYHLYRKNDLEVTISFFDGVAYLIHFKKLDHDASGNPAPLSDREIDQLLSVNGVGREWQQETQSFELFRRWHTSEGAMYALYDPSKHDFSICTRVYLERRAEEQKAKEDANLKGF